MEAAQGLLGAVVLRCRGPLRRRIPRSDPSRPARREHRGLGRPGKGDTRGLPSVCAVRSLRCPGVRRLSATPCLLSAVPGKHQGEDGLRTHPVSPARGNVHTTRGGV